MQLQVYNIISSRCPRCEVNLLRFSTNFSAIMLAERSSNRFSRLECGLIPDKLPSNKLTFSNSSNADLLILQDAA